MDRSAACFQNPCNIPWYISSAGRLEIPGGGMRKIARLFKNGRSQAVRQTVRICYNIFLSFTPQTRPVRQVVLQSPLVSLGLRKLPSRPHLACVNPLSATLMDPPASVANKELTAGLTPLDATFTKNGGVRGTPLVQSAERVFVTSLRPYLHISFTLARSPQP
jgi:hypothetical protein